MSLFYYLNKPEYLYRPRQILARMSYNRVYSLKDFVETKLPWGLSIRVQPHEAIGSSVLKLGLYDLTVSEMLWRLLEPGGCALDVGANIGHMSSIMIARAGREGSVHLFEPHPQVYQELDHNLCMWSTMPSACQVQANNFGLSDMNGEGIIEMPKSFDGNRGVAFVVPPEGMDDVIVPQGERYPIQLRRLDDYWEENGEGRRIDVVKIDVEGHEFSVLVGADGLIKDQMIKDIVFEENRPYPTDVTEHLSMLGYSVYLVEKGFWGPVVSTPLHGRPPRIPWEPPAYLATRDSNRAFRLFKKRGWGILTGRPVKDT